MKNQTLTIKHLASIILMALILGPFCGNAQAVSIIPVPVKVQSGKGVYSLSNSTVIIAKEAEAIKVANYLINKIKPATGYALPVKQSGTNGIQLIINTKPDQLLGSEGYTLETSSTTIEIKANTAAGLFYGVQTLLQLLPQQIESKTLMTNVNWIIPSVSILDYPRFGWRGLMLDVSRHFFPKEYVKEYIDRMARFKFNRFHWHLTDDNGWRVEIKSLPKLTEIGAWRVPRTGTFGSNQPPQPGEAATYGGYYTQEDIREVVQYAKERFIEILPEIDVPGHSMAAIAAYPELCVTKDTTIEVNPGSRFSKWFGNGKFEMYIDNTLNPTDPKVYQFLDKVFTEVAALFPFEYIHMGGDECYKGYWERDANVQAFMKKNNINTSDEMQAYFNKKVATIINSKKKKLIGWDEILEGGISPGAAVMSWRGTKGGIEAVHQKHKVVMSPAPTYYLDMMQGDAAMEAPVYSSARLKDVYAFEILPPNIDSTYVMGGQGNLWTEQIPTSAQAEYMIFPRALAITETLWSPRHNKNWEGFVARVENQFSRFDAAGVNYATSLYDPIINVTKNDKGKVVIQLATEVSGLDLFYTLDNAIPNRYHPKYSDPIVVPDDVDWFRVISYKDGKPVGRLFSMKIEDLVKRIK